MRRLAHALRRIFRGIRTDSPGLGRLAVVTE
jgi:hypothetical protein